MPRHPMPLPSAEDHDAAIRCPGCRGTSFAVAYRVITVCAVALSRAQNGEILVTGPGACIDPPPAPTARDFYEMRCTGCASRVDWELDHRSLYLHGR